VSPQPGSWRQTFRFVDLVTNLALSHLFEPPCAACGATLVRPLDGAVCDLCWSGIHWSTPPLCDRCGDPLPSSLASFVGGHRCRPCRESEHAVTRSRAIGPYEGRLREIVHALKYDSRRSIAPRLASMMRAAGADALEGADCVVPVPLHPRRQRARGFNQADDLARALGLPVMPLLERTRATPPQVDLPAAERARNVRNAFALSREKWRFRLPSAGCRLSAYAAKGRSGETSPKLAPVAQSNGGPLDGLVIVLVDDVSTTGATLEACARVLKAAGAREVRALTAARVVTGRP
jgi:predicted amidophosphoribosyltransferase